MLAKNHETNIVTSNEQHSALSVIDGGKKVTLDLPEGLLEVRKILDKSYRSAERVYDSVLSSNEREVLCFAAGLKRKDLNLKFSQLDAKARLAIRQAIFVCEKLFKSFNSVNAIAADKFVLPGEKMADINNPTMAMKHAENSGVFS